MGYSRESKHRYMIAGIERQGGPPGPQAVDTNICKYRTTTIGSRYLVGRALSVARSITVRTGMISLQTRAGTSNVRHLVI